MASLGCEFFGKKLKNPVILASGILGMTKASLEKCCKNGCGAVTTKSLSFEPRKGHEGPNIVETESGLLNAMGYPNPGIEEGLKEFGGWGRDEPLIISIVGKDAKEFAELAEKVEEAQNRMSRTSSRAHLEQHTVQNEPETGNPPLGATAIEAVLSCPHTPGYGTMAGQGKPESVSEITTIIKERTKLPLIIKLSPSVPGEVAAAKAAKDSGADAINMGNSLGPGMKIDIHRKRPILGFGMGGLSGPAIKPIAVRCVYDIYKAVKIPIIGTGGINSGVDAIEMLMAGASFVGVGTAVYYRGPTVFGKLLREMKAWMEINGYDDLKKLVGVAHE